MEAAALEVQQEISGGFRLSPQQRHLWALQQTDGALPWRARSVIRIAGPLDVKALSAALNEVTRQHEALQLSFQRLPGMAIPLQLRDQRQVLSGTRADNWEKLDPREQERRFEDFLQTADKTERPSISLVKLSETDHALLVDLPALCCDLRGLDNLRNEIARSYERALGHKTTPAESLQYTVISEWLNELLDSEDAEAGRAYWRSENISANFDLRLPYEKSASSSTSFQPRSLRRESSLK